MSQKMFKFPDTAKQSQTSKAQNTSGAADTLESPVEQLNKQFAAKSSLSA